MVRSGGTADQPRTVVMGSAVYRHLMDDLMLAHGTSGSRISISVRWCVSQLNPLPQFSEWAHGPAVRHRLVRRWALLNQVGALLRHLLKGVCFLF